MPASCRLVVQLKSSGHACNHGLHDSRATPAAVGAASNCTVVEEFERIREMLSESFLYLCKLRERGFETVFG